MSTNSNSILVLLYLYAAPSRAKNTYATETGDEQVVDAARALKLDPTEVKTAIRDLENLSLIGATEVESPGPESRTYTNYQVTSMGKEKAESLIKNPQRGRNLREEITIEKVDVVWGDISAIRSQLNELTQKVDRLVSSTEDRTNLTPEFVESSPGKRTFGEKVEGVLDEVLSQQTKSVEILIMGYFDHESLAKLKEVLAARGKIRIIHPDLTNSKQDQGNLDALRRIEKNGAEVRVHPMLHARVFYLSKEGQPWGVIIGSGDVKSDCMGGRRFDAGIWSNHPDLMKSAMNFFNRVWNDQGIKTLENFQSAK